MKDISFYFTPIQFDEFKFEDDQIGSKIIINKEEFPEIKKELQETINDFRNLLKKAVYKRTINIPERYF